MSENLGFEPLLARRREEINEAVKRVAKQEDVGKYFVYNQGRIDDGARIVEQSQLESETQKPGFEGYVKIESLML